MVRLNPDNSFAERPQIGERFLNLTTGQTFTVGATWTSGVVFEEGFVCSAFDLVNHFDPQCPTCKAFHEPEYPHEFTHEFRLHFVIHHGRVATNQDTFAHCSGVLKAAVATACA